METVPLSGKLGTGRFAQIDDDKLEVVSAHRWWLLVPQKGSTVYAVTQTRGDRCGECGHRPVRTVGMHNLVTGWPYVDHEDGNGLNNQGYNLREANQALNEAAKHKRPGTSSQFKGVAWDRKKNKWLAQITLDGKNVYLGRYKDEAEAAKAYDVAAEAAWGPFARLNFPDN